MWQAERLHHQVAYGTAERRPGTNAFKAKQPRSPGSASRSPSAPGQHDLLRSYIGSPANVKNQGIGIAVAGWGADFPTGYGFFNSIVNGANILPTGNSNYASLNDPTVNAILTDAPKADTRRRLAEARPGSHGLGDVPAVLCGEDAVLPQPADDERHVDNALAFGIYDFVNIGVTK